MGSLHKACQMQPMCVKICASIRSVYKNVARAHNPPPMPTIAEKIFINDM